MFECSKHLPTIFRCYTPTEFALFGIGAIVMGVMLGVVGISWFKHQVCILTEVFIGGGTVLYFAKYAFSHACHFLLLSSEN